MPRKRRGGSSIGRLTPNQKYHRKRHRSTSRNLDLDRHQVRMTLMTGQTQSQRMLEQVDLDLLEFLILQPAKNLDLGLLFKLCNKMLLIQM